MNPRAPCSTPIGVRLCALSVDLDEIGHYHAIHGLTPPDNGAVGPVYGIAIGRLRGWADALGVPLTWFAVGADVAIASNAARLRGLVAAGHEVGNHTLDHRYDLTRLSRDAIAAQIEGGADAIEHAVGARPVGFRAPGYVITDEVFDVLRELGVAYDSSVFPCPAYNLATAIAGSAPS